MDGMVIDQEIASVIRFMLNATDNPSPYYEKVPQDFLVPAAYFPPPEIDSQGYTMSTYALNFMWFITFFHKDDPSAHALGYRAIKAIKERKNAIPLVSEDGEEIGRGFRLKDPLIKPLTNASQLTLLWDSPRPYLRADGPTVEKIEINIQIKSAYDSALLMLKREGGLKPYEQQQ